MVYKRLTFYASANKRRQDIMFSGLTSVRPSDRPTVICPSVNTYFTRRDISSLNGRISVKLSADIRHVR